MTILLKNGKNSVLRCDQCLKEFCRRWKSILEKKPYHFCSHECSNLASKRGGVLFAIKAKTNLEKYGVEHHLKSERIRSKIRETCQEKYGGNAPTSSSEILDKIRKTVEDRYGCHFSKLDSVKLAKKKTCMMKYGVSSFWQTAQFKEMVNWKALRERGNRTRIERGITKVSAAEMRFGNFLMENYSVVESQVPINGWLMDFYIPEIDSYVQFDGNYWHGLDKGEEELLSSEKLVDKVILLTKKRDEEKERWFKANKMRLIRIDELQFKLGNREDILKKIGGKDDR